MRKVLVFVFVFSAFALMISCGGDTGSGRNENEEMKAGDSGARSGTTANGVGKYDSVNLTHPLDQRMIEQGQTAYTVKCVSCHKLTDEMLVGPGWKDVTRRRSPEWIMNFITNTEEMLNNDAEALTMLEICLVRMPNQNCSGDEARNLLEFMRSNDGQN